MDGAIRGFGINLLVWNSQIGPQERALLPNLAALGYNAVEVPIFTPQDFPTAETAAALKDAGLACTVSTALPPKMGLVDTATADAGVEFLAQVIDAAASLGASVVCGPLALPVGELHGRGATPQEWTTAVAALRRAAEVAADAGVTLALEPLNRFETYFINTVEQGVRLMDDVGHPAVGLLLDTFHMHIEEKSTPAALAVGARHLRHFHASENDRGVVGSGQVPWPSVWETLQTLGYEGWVTVESFNAFLPELAGATCIWRPLAPDPMTLAAQSLTYLQTLRSIRNQTLETSLGTRA